MYAAATMLEIPVYSKRWNTGLLLGSLCGIKKTSKQDKTHFELVHLSMYCPTSPPTGKAGAFASIKIAWNAPDKEGFT